MALSSLSLSIPSSHPSISSLTLTLNEALYGRLLYQWLCHSRDVSYLHALNIHQS